MASTFSGQSLFNSGPHRFDVGSAGRYLTAPLRGSNAFTYTRDDAKRELEIVQSGRLVATSESALWSLYDAVRAHAEAPTKATLVDHSGRSWTNMTMVSFDLLGPVDRGRVYSVSYRVRYLRFGGP